MSRLQQTLSGKLRAVRSNPLLVNSILMFATTLMMAAGGAIFWVVAARLTSPENVGLAGSLVSASDSLALFAQLGLNISLLRTMPTSQRKAADVATASFVVVTAGTVFALIYCLLLPVTSPRLHAVLGSPLTIGIYCVFVAATALNVLTDSIFLSINRLWSYLKLNGVLLGVAKCGLPFLLAGAGAMGLYGSVGGAILLCAVASLWVIFRNVPGRRSLTPSRELLDSARFAGAGYLTYVLYVVPQLVFPLLVINALGSARGGVFFISVQIVTLQNAVTLAIANSTYAEAERNPHMRRKIVRHGGITLAICAFASTAVMFVMAPYFLHIFGSHYAQQGTATLRILSFSISAAAFNYWSAIRLRIAHHLPAMILVQLVSTTVMLGIAVFAAPYGTVWVAAAWGIGHVVGGVVGYIVSRTIAPVRDAAPLREEQPEEQLAPAGNAL
jgi:O-antigen/teichoic acid export membrane protein